MRYKGDKLEQLILEYEKLIYSVMKIFRNYPNKEDLFQVGCIGLINAYNNYNSNINAKFSTYAYSYILGEMKKLGVGLNILNNNKWERLSEYKLPFERFILLYNDDFKICDIGVY